MRYTTLLDLFEYLKPNARFITWFSVILISERKVIFLDNFGVPVGSLLCFLPNDHFLNNLGVLNPLSVFVCLNDCALVSLGFTFGELVADDGAFSFCAMLGCDP